MKRRLLSAFLAVMMVLTMAPMAFAVNEGETTTETLQSQIDKIQETGTVTLDKDYNEDITISAGKNITINLNGKKLTNNAGDTITVALGANLTIEGEGTVDNISHGKAALSNNGSVILNGGTYIRSKENGISAENNGGNSFYAVLNHGTMTINQGATVEQNGHYSSLLENGYQNYASGNQRTGYVSGVNKENPTLNINGGLFTGGLNTVKNDDNGIITIKGGTFTNYTQAAFMNHHVATIEGGTFEAENVAAVLNCGTNCVLDATHDKHETTITNGYFKGALKKNFGELKVSGGYFTVDPSDYCVEDNTGISSGNTDYPYTVGEKVADTEPAKVDSAVVAATTTSDDDVVKSAANDIDGAELAQDAVIEAATKDEANKNTITAASAVDALKEATNDNSITKDNVKIVYQTYIAVSVSDAKTDATDNSYYDLTVDLTPMYRVIATTADSNYVVKDDNDPDGSNVNAVQVQAPEKLTLSNAKYAVTLDLPSNFDVEDNGKLSVIHNNTDYYTGTASVNGTTKKVSFETNGFSPFRITVPAVTNTTTEKVYPSLAAAIAEVKDNDDIRLGEAYDYNEKVTVTKTIKFTIKANDKTFVADKNVVAGNNTTVKVTSNNETQTYTYEFTYTKPSSGGSSGGSSSGKTTYKVTTSAVNNGGVNASPSTAEKGATITITLSPDKGYTLGKLTVTDGSGKTVSTVKKSDTVYTFTMPASAVTVGVSYVKTNETPSETKFNDVSANDWFASAVDYVTDRGMMNGTGTNTFGPKANTTRGMVVTVLYRLENEPSTAAASFTDVASGAYYANAVAWANANGIVSGYGNGKFGPNDKVTREQLAAILYRYAQYKKYDVSVGEDTNIMDFDDVRQISSYAVPAIQWACGAGVMSGKSTYTLDPKGDATRAEVAAMLMRFCENVK